MSDTFKRRLDKAILQKDVIIFEVLQGISGYTSSNPALTLASLTASKAALDSLQAADAQAKAAAATASDNSRDKEKEFHQEMLLVIDAIKAQFGVNSNEYQAVGRKKKVEYKSRRRKGRKNS